MMREERSNNWRTTFSVTRMHSIDLLLLSRRSLTYLIIIMLQSFNSLLVSPQNSHQTQRIDSPLNAIIPQPPMQTPKSKSTSNQQHSVTFRNHRMKLQCMRELRQVFSCLRRDERNRSIQIAANCVQGLLLLLNKQERSGNQVKQEKSQEEIGAQEMVESPLKFQRIVEKPIKPQGDLILILHSSTVTPTGNRNFFHFQMLSRESKIVNKSINLGCLSLVRQEVEKINKINSKICILVDDLRSPIQCADIENELSPLISTFSKLSEHLQINGQLREESEDLLSRSHQHRIQKSIIQVVRKYISIRQFIEYRLRAEWASSKISVLTSTAAYNILACLPNIYGKKIEQTLGYFTKVIQKAIHQQWKKEVNRHTKAAANLYHYPSSLQNAQKCWKCEKKRVYTFCPTCASIQGKVFALCLSCYQRYETHELLREGKKVFFEVDKLRAWKDVDLEVEEMVNEEIYDHLVDTRYQGYPN